MSRKRENKLKIEDEEIKIPSPTFVFEQELNIHPIDCSLIESELESGRQIKNTVLGKIYGRIKNMCQTKEWREIQKELSDLYALKTKTKIKDTEDKIKALLLKRNKMLELYKIKKNEIYLIEKEVRNHFSTCNSAIGQQCAERSWESIEKLLYKDGKKVHFLKYGEMNSIESKSNSAGIVVKYDVLTKDKKKKKEYDKKRKKDSKLPEMKVEKQLFIYFKGREILLKTKPIGKDDYAERTLEKIIHYFESGNEIEKENLKRAKTAFSLPWIPTFRVKRSRIIRKEIRGRKRYFIQFVLEGYPLPKYRSDGTPREMIGKGNVGNDIGTQSIAISSESKVVLKDLASIGERGQKKLSLTERKMNRSRRATNPKNYNADGTPKKGKREWIKSSRYKKLQATRKNLHRKNTINRKLSHHYDANETLRLGNRFMTEVGQYKALQKRAKVTKVSEKTGKFVRKKRFGRSILNCSPGYFDAILEKKVLRNKGTFMRVNNWMFKASQYDHKSDSCKKKQLSQRRHEFEDGSKIQRDLYSSFLMQCSDEKGEKPNRELCLTQFDKFKIMHDNEIKRIKNSMISVKNSGIKISKEQPHKKTFKAKRREHFHKNLRRLTVKKEKTATKILVAA